MFGSLPRRPPRERFVKRVHLLHRQGDRRPPACGSQRKVPGLEVRLGALPSVEQLPYRHHGCLGDPMIPCRRYSYDLLLGVPRCRSVISTFIEATVARGSLALISDKRRRGSSAKKVDETRTGWREDRSAAKRAPDRSARAKRAS